MVSRVKSDTGNLCTPSYASREMNTLIPRFSLPESSMPAQTAYRLIHDELMLDGNSRLNLATFVTTWMEPEAEALMAETFDKNMVDKDEYPQTAQIEERCVNMVSRLFHAPETGVGTSAIGSSEAVMLAGMALKWKWRKRLQKQGKPTDKPNLVMGSNVQVVWEKFCRYWEVEPRYIPMERNCFVITPEAVIDTVDENTIGVVAILGTTYTGEFEPVKAIHDALVEYNKKNAQDIPLHVDAASGGFVAPFIHPELQWDFRLLQVKSINVSGHKYGLVYPGVGWIIWRDAEELPNELVFHVNYLGGDMPTFTLNFSRPGNQVVAQYYNFIRLGFEGYRRIMLSLQKTAMYVAEEIRRLKHFTIINNGSTIPVIAISIDAEKAGFDEFALSDALRVHGWQVPAYTMPENIQSMSILRIVIREGFSMDMADALVNDFKRSIAFCSGQNDRRNMFSH